MSSSPPLTSVSPSGLNATALTAPTWPLSARPSGRRVCASQNATVPSVPATARTSPSGLAATASCALPFGAVGPTGRPRASHSRRVRSYPAEASVPSGVNASPRIQPRWPASGRLSGWRARRSQSWTMPCSPALARIPPSGLKATPTMPATAAGALGARRSIGVGDRGRRAGDGWPRRHRRTAASAPPLASVRPSGLKATRVDGCSWCPASGSAKRLAGCATSQSRSVRQSPAVASVVLSGLKATLANVVVAPASVAERARAACATSHRYTSVAGPGGEERAVRAERPSRKTVLLRRRRALGSSGLPRGDVPEPHRCSCSCHLRRTAQNWS